MRKLLCFFYCDICVSLIIKSFTDSKERNKDRKEKERKKQRKNERKKEGKKEREKRKKQRLLNPVVQHSCDFISMKDTHIHVNFAICVYFIIKDIIQKQQQ